MRKETCVKWLLSAALALFCSTAHAQFNQPQMYPSQEQGGLTPLAAPCYPQLVGQSTGTSNTLLFSGPGYLNWIAMSSATADGTHYVTVIDSAPGQVSAASITILPRLYLSTAAQPSGNLVDVFNPPVLFLKGLSVTLNSGSDQVTVCGRPLSGRSP